MRGFFVFSLDKPWVRAVCAADSLEEAEAQLGFARGRARFEDAFSSPWDAFDSIGAANKREGKVGR